MDSSSSLKKTVGSIDDSVVPTGDISNNSYPFKQGQDQFNLPEEPVVDEVIETLVRDAPTVISEDADIKNEKPWFRRPSAWWMLTLMPINAMTLAGVGPAAVQIYTDLVCRAIEPELSRNHHITLPSINLQPSYNTSIEIMDKWDFMSYDADGTFPDTDFAWTFITRQSFASTYENNLRQLDDGGLKNDNDKCYSNPKVSAITAKLITAITASLGILSTITAASWASLSDRIGRTSVLSIAGTGVLASYTLFIAVNYFPDAFPGGFWFLIIGASVYGLLGGTAAASAATSAYIADCTPSSSRARTFSLTLGLRFTGMAIGPTLNSFLVQLAGTPVASLALVVIVHVIYVVLMLLVVPESLAPEKQAENRRVWKQNQVDSSMQSTDANTGSARTSLLSLVMSGPTTLTKNLFAIIRPLAILKPFSVPVGTSGKIHRDWSVTFIAISNGLASLILASYPTMFQYAMATYGWATIELGYWFSGIVAARAITLTLILPVLIKLYHYSKEIKLTPKTTSHADNETSESTPLLISPQTSSHSQATSQTNSHPSSRRHTPAFDMAIAQASLALEVVCFGLTPFAPSQPLFIALTVLAACGSGFGPAIQSLVVELYSRRGGTETGRLFGVLGVVQVICSQVFGPTLYGVTYMNIVSFYPQGIFFVSLGAVASSIIALLFVELPGSKKSAIDDMVDNA